MGSGYFPLDSRDDEGRKIVNIIQQITDLRDEWAGYIMEQDQVDNAAYDGGYLERFSIAAEMLQGVLKREIKK